MPGLKAFLQKTMIFTAAAPKDLYGLSKLDPSAAIVPTAPVPTTQVAEEERAVWNWRHDPNAPAKITDLTAIVRAMGNMTMTVCDSIEVERVAISVEANSPPVVLPLDVDHVVAKFSLDKGRIPASTEGWWRLEANTDYSMAVVFAYEIVGSMTAPLKVSLRDLENDSAFPTPPVPRGDPDYMDQNTLVPPAAAGQQLEEAKTLQNTVTAVPQRHFVVVVFGLTPCKERGDFEPVNVLGAGRIYPHVMLLSSQGIVSAEATIHVRRPDVGMKDAEMDGQIMPLLATDANVMHSVSPFGALPLWSNVFDYVVTNPLEKIGLTGQDDKDASGANWMTVVDPTKKQRTIVGKIKRETFGVLASENFTKLAMQGEFDNIHLAPGMIHDPLIGPRQTGIKMAPFCVHDCFHTHFRWGNFQKTVGPLPKWTKGFNGRIPYGDAGIRGDDPGDGAPLEHGDGRPLVPSDQTVKIGLTGSSSFRYFAKSTPGDERGGVRAGTWTVFNHHGSAYALGVASEFKWGAARVGGQLHAESLSEPDLYTFNAATSTAAFYWRLRWTGAAANSVSSWTERLKILDVSATTGVRS